MNGTVRRFMPMFLLACALALPGISQGQDWPQFRGPGGQGHSAATDAPLHWSESDNVVWKVPIAGRGWSSLVVLGEQVWLTTAMETAATPADLKRAVERAGVPVPDPHMAGHVTLKAICIDRGSGHVVHDLTLFDVDEPVLLNPANSYASPTPVAESGRVYCDFGAMGTACLDAVTGKILWSRRLVVEHQAGPGSSPILHDDLLILVRDGCDQQYVMALNKKTGETIWKTPRPPIETALTAYRKAFSTPLVLEENGVEQMVVPGAKWVVSYDPATGQEQWRVDTGSSFSNTSRPVYGHGLVYVCTAYGGTRILAIRANGREDVTESHVAWELSRGTPKRSSPLLVDDLLYFVSDRGVASCVDAARGEVRWTERLPGAHSASPVYAGGRIYLFSETGTTTVVSPGDEFRRLAENHVDGRIMATPAFVGRSILLRTDSHLYRID